MNRRSGDRRFSGLLSDRIRHARRLGKLSQVALANNVGVVPSAVAQWEGIGGTSPTVEHLIRVASCTGVAFEWLATGRGPTMASGDDIPAILPETFAQDLLEERLLLAFRGISLKRREPLITLLEKFLS